MIPFTAGPALPGIFTFTAPLAWTVATVGLSVLLWLLLRAKGWGAAAGWTALAFAGQACALQLLEVGNRVRLQMFFGWSELLRTWRGVFLLILALQGLLVAWGAWKIFLRDNDTRKKIPQLISGPQALVLLLLAMYGCATIAPGVAQAFVNGGFAGQAAVHASKIALGLAVLVVGLLNLLLVAATLPGSVLERLRARWENSERPWLPWAAALWVVVFSSLIAWVVFDRMPHLADEVAHIFQAKYLSIGKLYLPPPVDAEALAAPFQLVEGDKWFASPQFGSAVPLALGYRLGVPWLINPLLGGCIVLLAHIFLRRVYNRKLADAAALLMAFSPWLLFLSASVMPHTSALALTLLGMVAVERARNARSIAWAAVAGLSIGAALHVRALEAVIVASVMGVWWLSGGWKKLSLAAVASTALTGSLMAVLFLACNKLLVGNPFLVPINRYFDLAQYPGSNRLGFGPDVGNFGWTGLDALPGHGPIDVLMNTNQNLYLVNFDMFGWACGSLIFVFLLIVWRKFRSDVLLWGFVLATWALLSLYWYSGGPDFGPRYWYQMFVPLAALTVRGAEELAARLRSAGAVPEAGARVGAFILIATLLGAANIFPWRSLDKYHNYRRIVPDIRAMERQYNFGRSLVLIRGKAWPDYDSAFPFNPPRFDRDVPGTIYARDLGPQSVARLRAYYSDRPVWVLAGPSETGDGFKLIEQPRTK
ncbi:MAG: hypothetical protein M1453_09125 [Acidobacteria bacterium]|nr:hypothetical protein [Acidobacteriota bacterium]MCL5288137.1 hypothetical protein [Acidobacteriota bacterium]